MTYRIAQIDSHDNDAYNFKDRRYLSSKTITQAFFYNFLPRLQYQSGGSLLQKIRLEITRKNKNISKLLRENRKLEKKQNK